MSRSSDAKLPWRIARAFRRAKRTYVIAPLITALSLIVMVVLFTGGTHRTPPALQPQAVPQFDLAIGKFDQMADGFVPNVPSEAFDSSNGSYYAWVVSRDSARPVRDDRLDLARAYQEVDMPANLYDFDSSGYDLYGGRFDHLADGRPVTYTLYRGRDGALMDICIKDARMAIPVSAVYWVGMHSFYRYKKHSLCVTFDPTGRFVSIVVTNGPLVDLVRDVTLADMATTAQ